MAEFTVRRLGGPVCRLGESPLWCERSGELVYVDLDGRALVRYQWASGRWSRQQFDERVCAVAETTSDDLLLGLEQRLELVGTDGGRVPVSESTAPDVRINDGACDPAGRMYVGTVGYTMAEGAGGLFRLAPDGTLEPVTTGQTVPNGIGWSPSGEHLYHVDSLARSIAVHAYDVVSGAVVGTSASLDLSGLTGYPDGLAVDADGNLWVAFWDGGVVRCLTPDARVLHEVPVPVPRVTSCGFAGPGRETLVVTTGADPQDPHPDEGLLFAADVGVRGAARPVWSGPES